LIKMTQRAIDSCLADGADVNVIVVETFKKTEYRGANKTVMYEGEFNYNRCLNTGIKYAKGDVFILANNDIIFERGWSQIGYLMEYNNYLSASALSNDRRQKIFRRGNVAYEGYLIGLYLTGWCIFAHKKVFEQIGKLDETHKFWYSDDVYAEQLRQAKIKHALICNCVVNHLVSKTLSTKPIKERHILTYAEGKRVHKTNRENIQTKL